MLRTVYSLRVIYYRYLLYVIDLRLTKKDGTEKGGTRFGGGRDRSVVRRGSQREGCTNGDKDVYKGVISTVSL